MARFVNNNQRNGENDVIRQKMRSYWQLYSPTLESMLLSNDASYFAQNEQNEILSYLPPYQGKRVLELGAGIGRFTSQLAVTASEVTAVDFMEQYLEENRKTNQHLSNINFKCADVTRLDFPAGSFDLIFSNWLFMYLTDEETLAVFHKVIRWLAPGGYFFLRESCYHQSGNVKRNENPTLYRTPLEYCQMLHEVAATEEAAFKIIRGKSILAYIHLCFLAKRVDGVESHKLIEYLQSRYSVNYIRTMERIFGYNWLSTGGEYTTRNFLAKLCLSPGQQVLDVGCGSGASAFYIARHYSAHVHGVDLSTNMIHVAIERQDKLESELKQKVQFEISDILTVDLEEGAYDLIYSRDSILYIKEKDTLFQKLFSWLKPGGTLFFTDYCSGTTQNQTDDFIDYTHNQRRYFLATVNSYRKQLEAAGFSDVKAEDLHHDFINIHQTELNAFTATREAFVRDFSQEEFDEISDRWAKKIRWAQEGQLSWGAFTAHKSDVSQ